MWWNSASLLMIIIRPRPGFSLRLARNCKHYRCHSLFSFLPALTQQMLHNAGLLSCYQVTCDIIFLRRCHKSIQKMMPQYPSDPAAVFLALPAGLPGPHSAPDRLPLHHLPPSLHPHILSFRPHGSLPYPCQ